MYFTYVISVVSIHALNQGILKYLKYSNTLSCGRAALKPVSSVLFFAFYAFYAFLPHLQNTLTWPYPSPSFLCTQPYRSLSRYSSKSTPFMRSCAKILFLSTIKEEKYSFLQSSNCMASYQRTPPLPPSCSFEYHSTYSGRCNGHTTEYCYSQQTFLCDLVVNEASQTPGLQI